MSLRIIRESSNTPNVTNKDDIRMVRYAYGGYSGIVQNFKSEIAATVDSGVFHIGEGKIVIQGWEIDIEDGGWSFDVSNVYGTQYHAVYLELNAETETAQIKSTFLSGSIPSVSQGDDLTAAPNGTARIVLYSFKVSNTTISEVQQVAIKIPYLFDIDERLKKLGFREGSVLLPEGTTTNSNANTGVDMNYLKRQGNYVIGQLSCNAPTPNFPIQESGLLLVGTVPSEFLPDPQKTQYIMSTVTYVLDLLTLTSVVDLYFLQTGEILLPAFYDAKTVVINFGYEARPL